MCDGHIVFAGPPNDVPDYFNRMNIEFKRFTNPADIAMKELSISYPKKERDT